MQIQEESYEPIKDENAAHPIASVWRPALRDVVKAFIHGDYGLTERVGFVPQVSAAKAKQIREYIADYGETLVELPAETWATSVSQWMGGYWEVVVDLWTAESGRSDMVLSARIFEEEAGFRIEVDSVHVP